VQPNTKVFLSSTYTDLVQHREVLIDTLHRFDPPLELCAMEFFGASERNPIAICQEKVAASDIYVGLFGWRYGFVDKRMRMSVTEIEYRAALTHDIPTFLYLMSEAYSITPSAVDTGRKGAAIRRLRAEVQQRHTVQFFTTPEDLSRRVATDLANRLRQSLPSRTARPGPPGPVEPDINSQHPFILCHQVSASRIPDLSNVALYIDVYENDPREERRILTSIDRVIYQLHRSFPTPVTAMQNWWEHFRIDLRVWGEFWVQATILFKDRRQPAVLKRFINLELPPPLSRPKRRVSP
jgi:hypothetical protein